MPREVAGARRRRGRRPGGPPCADFAHENQLRWIGVERLADESRSPRLGRSTGRCRCGRRRARPPPQQRDRAGAVLGWPEHVRSGECIAPRPIGDTENGPNERLSALADMSSLPRKPLVGQLAVEVDREVGAVTERLVGRVATTTHRHRVRVRDLAPSTSVRATGPDTR
jgi:hypothetical protein